MDTAQWPPQGLGFVKEVESRASRPQLQVERRPRPQKEQALNCPRCNSINTKFCYYNNYSLSQPRYFCKTCRRYWTEGGSLRNVPVGGGSRKNKRSSSSSSSFSSTSSSLPSSSTPAAPLTTASPLSLPSSSSTNVQPSYGLMSSKVIQGGFHVSDNGGSLSALRPFFPAQAAAAGAVFGGGFGFQDLMLRPSELNLPIEGGGSGFNNGNMQEMQERGEGVRLLLPFEHLKQVPVSINGVDNEGLEQGQGDQALFWNGIMGNGGRSW